MSITQLHNFGAGPCILPQSVLKEAAMSVQNWDGLGLSILEVSHRSDWFIQVMEQTQSLVRELLIVPSTYEVLFLQGGASSQFSMVPMNLLYGLGKSKSAYLDTGYFAQKAIAEAEFFGKVQIVGSSKDRDYSYIPEVGELDEDCAYLHVTSNNTIEGTEIFDFPQTKIPLVCDMSSDIFSRVIDINQFDLVYAGAQKNMGPAGMTLVIVKKMLLDQISHPLAAMSDYRVYAANQSMYNTPPVFSIYVAMLNLKWLKSMGGVAAIEKLNIRKADLLYSAIDQSYLFSARVEANSRSRVNVTFDCEDPSLEKDFLNFTQAWDIIGIKGYPLVGGFRASMYNAMPLESVVHLVDVIENFELQRTQRNVRLDFRFRGITV